MAWNDALGSRENEMAKSLKPCPNCGRLIDHGRSICLYCKTAIIDDVTVMSPPPAFTITPLTLAGGLVAVLVIGLVAGWALFAPKRQKLPDPPPQPAVQVSATPDPKSFQPTKADDQVRARNEALRIQEFGGRGGAYQQTFGTPPRSARSSADGNPSAYQAPTYQAPAYQAPQQPQQQAQVNDGVRAILNMLDQLDADFAEAMRLAERGPVGVGSENGPATRAASIFVQRAETFDTALKTELEKQGVNRFLAAADVQHVINSAEDYSLAASMLKMYVLAGSEFSRTTAYEKRQSARNHRNALEYLSR